MFRDAIIYMVASMVKENKKLYKKMDLISLLYRPRQYWSYMTQEYMDGPKSNENDFFAQRSRARKG